MRAAISSALVGVSGREETFVWELFKRGLPNLEEVLRPTYGAALSINGVFCHGHPRAHFDNRAGQAVRPEAGDLLIVVHHLLTKGRRIRRSLLLQLKMADRPNFSGAQIELYADWPPFEFVYTPANRRARRHVLDGEHRGAQFGFIDRATGEITIDQGPHRPMAAIAWEDLLATEVLAMLTTPQVGGREFVAKTATDRSGWSPVVWDLLRTTFSASTYAGTGPDRDRVLKRGEVMLMLAPEIPQLVVGAGWRADAEELWAMAMANDAPDLPPELDTDDVAAFEGPVSTILLELDWSAVSRAK